MIYCTRCGRPSEDGVRFCSYCGAQLETGLQRVPESENTQRQSGRNGRTAAFSALSEHLQRLLVMTDETYRYREDDRRDNKYVALLSYLHILVLVPTFSMPESHFVQYHARCGWSLLFWQIVAETLSWVLTTLLGGVPVLGALVWILCIAANLILWVIAAAGIVSCVKEKARIPTVLLPYHLFRANEPERRRK